MRMVLCVFIDKINAKLFFAMENRRAIVIENGHSFSEVNSTVYRYTSFFGENGCRPIHE